MLDGDDYWTDAMKLQKLVNFLEQNPNYTITSHEVNTIKINIKNNFKAGIGIIIDNFRFGKFSHALKTAFSLINNKIEFWKSRVSHNSDKRFYHYNFQNILLNRHFMATSSMMMRKDVVKKIGLWYTETDGGHYFIVLIALSLGKGYHFKDFMGIHNLHEGSISQDLVRKKILKKRIMKDRIFRLDRLLEIAPKYNDIIMQQIKIEQEKNDF
jgi:hypothetical protein